MVIKHKTKNICQLATSICIRGIAMDQSRTLIITEAGFQKEYLSPGAAIA